MTSLIWNKIKVRSSELSLYRVLRCGQAFRWKQINEVWSCSLHGRVIFLKQDQDFVYYASVFASGKQPKLDDTQSLIEDYFQLSVNLTELYTYWNKIDANFNKNALNFTGIRILRQDPWENLVSFICSSNNNIKRISKMCNSLCENFGTFINKIDDINYYDFPTPEQLAKIEGLEAKLRDLGFGYRASYIAATSKMITAEKDGLQKLINLRNESYETCFQKLIQFKGVGPKVADCVCLMSLDKHDIVPIDTHVFNIVKRDYKFKSSSKNLNNKLYLEIRHFLKKLWGEYAGWAHSILFTADLKDLNNGINKSEKIINKSMKMIKIEEIK
ncbi:hypothetical protein PACTADRAFT_31311 [Pachysolen tannophilus NRRL Y-2460]|uniref:N-glycosylase/DNA lyase n=1 Tax=Pachysolen tannophilus NRRL Y-2460 TaxID=669874 RepID=A0A1E4U1L3_PACTA|nr:hypothetical protein PACTADRAFT_31311 [Pachysolen tannophilus NRRL Y-2460]